MPVLLEFRAGETRKSFAIFRARLLNDLPRQMWRGRRFVPVECLQIIAHKLFVETRRADADLVLIRWPETRGIRSETFVDQEQVITQASEVEFCVGDNDSTRGGVFTSRLVDFEAEIAGQLRPLRAAQSTGLVDIDDEDRTNR